MKGARLLSIVMYFAFWAGSLQGQTTAVVGGTLIDGTGAPPVPNGVILIDGKKITAIGEKGEVKVPAGAEVIDATGKYVIPGLVDVNVHLILNNAEGWLGKYEGRYEDIAAEAAQLALENGLTTVFDSWGPLQPLLNVRDRIRRGELVGSRLYVAGNIVGLSGPLGRDFKSGIELATVSPVFAERINKIWEENVGPDLLDKTPEEIRIEIRKYIARGVDFIKFAASSHSQLARQNSWLMFSPEVLRIIVEEAHKAGITVQSHTTNSESLRLAVSSGIDLAQHPEGVGARELPGEVVKLIVEQKVYCGVLSKKKVRIELEKEVWSQSGGRAGGFAPDVLEHRQRNIEKLNRAGALIALATDAGTRDPEFTEYPSPRLREHDPYQIGEAHFLWLESMIEKGMSPMNAIIAATKSGAAAYGHLSDFGTLEPNKLADLLLLDASPLEDISNVRKLSLVMKEGVVIERVRLREKKLIPK